MAGIALAYRYGEPEFVEQRSNDAVEIHAQGKIPLVLDFHDATKARLWATAGTSAAAQANYDAVACPTFAELAAIAWLLCQSSGDGSASAVFYIF